jgi:hypothetical protein
MISIDGMTEIVAQVESHRNPANVAIQVAPVSAGREESE